MPCCGSLAPSAPCAPNVQLRELAAAAHRRGMQPGLISGPDAIELGQLPENRGYQPGLQRMPNAAYFASYVKTQQRAECGSPAASIAVDSSCRTRSLDFASVLTMQSRRSLGELAALQGRLSTWVRPQPHRALEYVHASIRLSSYNEVTLV